MNYLSRKDINMTYEETKQILSVLKANYFNFFKDWNKEQGEAFLSLWSEAFKNDNTEQVVKAVKSIIYTNVSPFPPSIAQVKNEMFKDVSCLQLQVGTAWEMVLRSAKCDYQQAKENFNKLPFSVQEAVGSPSFLVELGYSNSDGVGYKRKEFEAKYNQVQQEEKEMYMLCEISLQELQTNNQTLLDTPRKAIE